MRMSVHSLRYTLPNPHKPRRITAAMGMAIMERIVGKARCLILQSLQSIQSYHAIERPSSVKSERLKIETIDRDGIKEAIWARDR